MGGCGSSVAQEDKEGWKRSREVDMLVAADARKEAKKIRLLLLGPGESGKSTIFRQMKLLYGSYTDSDKEQMTLIVFSNVVMTMKTLIKQADQFGFADEIQDKGARDLLRGSDDMVALDETLGAAIKTLWADDAIQRTWVRRSEYQIVDSMSYFLDDMDRIKAPGYQANEQDMLHVRIRSSGVVVDRYVIDGTAFEMYDVGGQRNERKKWIHCFDNVTAVIYVAALSEFDQHLFEDSKTNRMVEAVTLFREICHNPYFEHTSIILFLNKRDLFEAKLQVKSIRDVEQFSDYVGAPGAVEEGIQYFLTMFRQQWMPEQTHYHHVTCATDTGQMEIVLTSCRDTILRHNLRNSGFIS